MTPDISWSALPLGIHDNTVSWEVGMTTTAGERRERGKSALDRKWGEEEDEVEKEWKKDKKPDCEQKQRQPPIQNQYFTPFFNVILF